MDISTFLPIFYPLIPILPIAIIFAGILAIVIEIREFNAYKDKDCKQTEELINKLENCKQNPQIDALSETEIRWFYKHIEGRCDRIQNKHIFQPKKEKGYYLVLEYPTILSKAVPHSPVAYAPTALISSGIFSTFLGISQGAAGGDSNDLLLAGKELFSSLKHVFFTSLLGLGFATILMILIAVFTKKKEKHRNKLRKKLNDIAITLTPEKILSRINPAPNDHLAEALENVARRLSTLSADAIGQAVSQAIVAGNSSLLQEIKHLQNIQEDQGSTVIELEQKLIQPVVKRLEESAELTKDASSAVRELKSELGGISQNLAGAVSTIQVFQKQTLTDLKEFAGSLDTTLKDFQNETKDVLKQVGTEINQAVKQSIIGMTAQREAFKQSATEASTTFRGIREDLQSALTTQAKQQKEMLDVVTAQTKAILQEANSIFQNQSTTLKTVGQEAANLMNVAKANLSSTLENIDNTLQKTSQTVQEELENFREQYQASLNIFFQEQNNLLNETLGKQRDGLAQVVASLQQTFHEEAEKRQQMSQQVDISMNKINNTAETVYRLANTLGLTSSERLGQLQELSRTIGGEAHRVENAYQNMTIQFKQSLEEGNRELSNYLKNANESYSNYFKKFDKATGEAYKEINNTYGELLKAAQYLVAAADISDSQRGN
jgi:hypothetical protein